MEPAPTAPAAPSGSQAPAASAADLYRSAWSSARDIVRRRHLDLIAEGGLILAYFLLRTVGAGPLALAWWVVAAIGLALVSPVAGLVVLAAIAPFDEPLGLSRALGFKHLLLLAIAASVGARILPRPRSFPRSVPLLLAAGLAIGTLAGVALGYRKFGSTIGWENFQYWLAGMGGGLIVLLAAAWVARRNEPRPFIVAVVAAAIGGYVSLVDWLRPALIRDGPLDWLVSANRFDLRLTGIIASPNAVAAAIVVPTAFLAVQAVLGREPRTRILAGLATLPLLGTLWFTYSRAALLAVFAIAVICAWRIRRPLGAGLLAVGLVVGILVAPGYLAARHDAVGGEGTVTPGSLLVASDQMRFRAWGATVAMAADSPLYGHGFRSFKRLGPRYGEPVLGSPHNEWLRPFAEEGVFVGLIGLGFLASTLVVLARQRGVFFTAVLAGFAGWAIMATFNNPFLFIQVNVVVFTVLGTALAMAAGKRAEPAHETAATQETTIGFAASGPGGP